MGAVSASFELASLVKKAIEFAHHVKGFPKKASLLLNQLDHEITSINRLLDPDSHSHKSLSDTQHAIVFVSAVKARKVMVEIQEIIVPLVEMSKTTSGRATIQVWNSFVTAKKQKEVREKTKLLKTLNDSLQRGLQVSGFETQSLLCEQSSSMLSKTNALATKVQEVQRLTQQTNILQSRSVDAIQSRITSTENQLLLQANDNLSTLQQSLAGATTHITFLLNKLQMQSSTHQTEVRALLEAQQTDFDQLIRILASNPTAPLRDIRNILGALLDDAVRQQPYTNSHSELDLRDPDLETSLLSKAARLGSSSCSRYGSEPRTNEEPQRPFELWRCKCRAKPSTTRWAYGSLGLRVESSAVRNCPVHGKKSTRSYSIEVKLSPFLQGVLEFSLSLFSGRKGWGISPYVKFRSVVKRSESTIFQLFDGVREQLRDTSSLPPTKYPSADRISMLVRKVEESIECGHASGNDEDENGATLLMETLILVASLPENDIEHYSEDLARLINIACISGADPMMSSGCEVDHYSGHTVIWSSPKSIQVSRPMEYLLAISIANDFVGVPMYNTIKEYGELTDSLCDYIWMIGNNESTMQRTLIACPEIAEELAIGWPEGLRFLVDQGCDIGQAFDMTCEFEDSDSAAILLATDRSILTTKQLGCSKCPLFVEMLKSAKGCEPIFQMVAKEVLTRGEEFKSFALQRLSQDEQDEVGLSKSCVIHENGPEIYRSLKRRFGVPERLDCMLGGSPLCSQYFSYIKDYSVLSRHKMIYDAGFTWVNIPCAHGMAPLAEYCEWQKDRRLTWFPLEGDRIDSLGREWNETVSWYLERGASADFDTEIGPGPGWPHLLFYATAEMRSGEVDRQIMTIGAHDYMVDRCECLCSSGGCIPQHWFWSLHLSRRFPSATNLQQRVQRRRIKNLQYWTRVRGFSRMQKEHCYQAICRLETFERLDMRHTCCKSAHHTVDGIQLTDVKCARRLEQFLKFYSKTRRLLFNYPIEEFFGMWWETVDVILPPLRPRSCDDLYVCPCSYVLPHRKEKLDEVLQKAGYGGLEYEEVVRCHFTKFLVKCKALLERRHYQKRHRLMGNPMSAMLRRTPKVDVKSACRAGYRH
ncbi:hypothetical protein F5Y04DRAFT_287387 [Hypomontagnella monticulosa]|nr:hypothetical protein F5Y04DRAFT_287387 [Hypomontagnella monticulosa]